MPTQNRPVRALVVDDNPDAAESLSRLLEVVGCAATFVTDSLKAIDTAEAIGPGIVLLDIGMPGFDGYELARMVRSRYGEAIVLVALTGYDSDEHHKKARDADFDADLRKPISIKSIESLLKSVLAMQSQRR
jgi:CheY-like chemotaxis protein